MPAALSVTKKRTRQLPRGQKQQIPPPPPQNPPKEHRKWWWLLLQPKLLLIEIPSLIGGITALAVLWNSAVPTILPPQNVSRENPLLAPFVIKNEGWLLTFREVTTNCRFDRLGWPAYMTNNGWFMAAVNDNHWQPGGSVFPGRSVTVNCAVFTKATKSSQTQNMFATLISARAQVAVHYYVIWLFSREYISQHYCWSAQNPQWVLCDSL
jgi:hypothetical protein